MMHTGKAFRISLLFLLLLTLVSARADTITAKVVGVTDGDTVKVLTNSQDLIKVRLAEIDTPERRQPWFNRAKQALAGKIFGKTVRIEVIGRDRYGRSIGKIFLGQRDINRELVREGHAWVYRKYMKDPTLLDDEEQARREHLGIWSLPEAQRTPPWEWRKKRRKR